LLEFVGLYVLINPAVRDESKMKYIHEDQVNDQKTVHWFVSKSSHLPLAYDFWVAKGKVPVQATIAGIPTEPLGGGCSFTYSTFSTWNPQEEAGVWDHPNC